MSEPVFAASTFADDIYKAQMECRDEPSDMARFLMELGYTHEAWVR